MIMENNNAWRLHLILLLFCSPVRSSSHWIVTEEGKIEAQVNSIFHMKRPYDLVAFLEQERRVDLLESLREEMSQHNLDQLYTQTMNDQSLESHIFDYNPDCQAAGQTLTEFDLFAGTLIHPDYAAFGLESILDPDMYSNLPQYELPHCSDDKAISLGSLEKLSAMLRINDLRITPELGLVPGVLQHGRFNLGQYGHLVAKAFTNDPKNWILNLLASSYWRIAGKASETVHCLRKAIALAPFEYRHYGLLALANVFHRAHRSEDAVLVLEEALTNSPRNPVIYFAMGNVYASLMQFQKAEDCYGSCLELQPTFDEARYRRHAVRCHITIESQLDHQRRTLDASLQELRKYKQHHEKWSSLVSRVVSEQASPEVKIESRMVYEQFKIQVSDNGRGQDCVQYESHGQTYLSCDIRRELDTSSKLLERERAKGDVVMDKVELENLLRAFEYKVDLLGSAEGGSVDSRKEKTWNGSLDDDDDEHEDPYLPSLEPLYDIWPGESVQIYHHSDPNWPCKTECTSDFAKPPLWNDYPTVFLSPENKGFDIKRMMSSDIEFPSEHPAPLPWFPPICKSYEGTVPKYDQLKTIAKWTHISVKKPEKEIEPAYDLHSPERNFHEWGARVTAAMKLNLAPKWIVYLLAGTYWRIWGHPQNGIHCYRHSLSRVPERFKDVVLTNFAGLLYKTGAIDEALVMMKDAIDIDPKDPYSNFFIANLYSGKGNMSGAIHHYKQALRMKPDFAAAYQYLHVPACHIKFHQHKQSLENSCKDDFTAECLNSNSLSKIDGMDAMILCQDGHCKFVSADEYGDVKSPVQGHVVPKEKPKEVPVINNVQKIIGGSGFKIKPVNRAKPVKEQETDLHPKGEITKYLKSDGKQHDDLDTESGNLKEDENSLFIPYELVDTSSYPISAVEIGTIAETEHEEDEEEEEEAEEESDDHHEEIVHGPVLLVDDPLPDVLLRVREKDASPLPTSLECAERREVKWATFTSTWLSVAAKGVNIRELIVDKDAIESNADSKSKPFCMQDVPVSLLTMDHMEGVKKRKHLYFASEKGLKDAFQALTGEENVSVKEMAARIAYSMAKNSTSWELSTVAALYWRVKGNAEQAVNCLRHSLYQAPRDMKDIPLISLANVMHRAGMYNDALILTNMALEISPKFVVIHFTMANIYVSKGNIDQAISFYLSTLALQAAFEPAKDRLLSLQC